MSNLGHPSDLPARIEVFGFDVAEISQIRRIRAMVALGHDVHSFTMRRSNMNADFAPDWPNTHLFVTENENLIRRAAAVAGGIVKSARHRARLRAADAIFARNLDMLAIAWAARKLTGSRAPLVYECLDIHGALSGQGAKGRAMRRAERRLLRDCALLVVSSPAFIRAYFEPVQRYSGPWALWENKLAAGTALPPRPTVRDATGGPLRLGWVGTIRCAPSLALLADLADRMGPEIEIHIYGIVHDHAVPDFETTVGARENMLYHGGYAYPQDLARVYSGMDLVWAQDLWQRGQNSDWLLPNRIYEASWAGCPSLALASTETGRRVAEDALGWTVETADAAHVRSLVSTLTKENIAKRGQALLDRPAGNFVQTPEDIQAVITKVARAA